MAVLGHGWAHARASRHLGEVLFVGEIPWLQGFKQSPPVAGHLLDGNLQYRWQALITRHRIYTHITYQPLIDSHLRQTPNHEIE